MTIEEIEAMLNKIDGQLPMRRENDGRELFCLEVTQQERNLLADAINDVLERRHGSH